MPLVDAFDHFFSEPGKLTGSDGEERRLRFELLRGRIEERLARELGLDEHSLAVPVMAAYLEPALGLYVLGYFEPCIREAHERLASLARVLADSQERDLERLLGEPAVAHALAPGGQALADACARLARKRRDLHARADELARSVLLGSVERGRASGGYGAVIAESPTSQRVRWGADLHDLLAQAVRVACLLIEASRVEPRDRRPTTGAAPA